MKWAIKRPVKLVTAAVTLRKRIFGRIFKLFGTVEVERSRDLALKGEGKISEIH